MRSAEDLADMYQALFYHDREEYLDGLMRFIEPAFSAGDPVAAALPPEHGALLRERLNGSADKVELLDMFELGRNPARIIPAVEGMLAKHKGRLLHYIGEPIWAGRSADEIREATKHEALINLAWPGARIRVLCPYDAVALEPEVLADAERTHPCLVRDGHKHRSPAFSGPAIPVGCEQPLPDPPPSAHALSFGVENLSEARNLVWDQAAAAGLAEDRAGDLVLAVSELATNAIRHGRGDGTLHLWTLPDELVRQVLDLGHITDPLAGRRLPVPDIAGGVGLWTVNQLCDLVEVRSGERGTTVRVHATL